MLSGSWDSTVSIFDLEQQQQTGNSILPMQKSSRCSAVTGVTSLLARGNANNSSTTTPTTTTTPSGHSAAVSSVQWYTYDNGMFVSSSLDGSVLLWDTNLFQTAYAFTPFKNHTNNCGVTSMCLPKGTTSLHSLIATGSGGSSAIVLCDVNSGASVHTLEGHGGSVQCLTWSPTNDYQLCSGSIDGTARLWDIRKPGSHSCVCILNYHGPNHEHSNYFSISDGKEATQFRSAPNAYAHLQSCSISTHEDPSTSITNVAYSPDGSYLTTIGTDGEILLWKDVECHSSSAAMVTDALDNSTGTTKQLLPAKFLGEDQMKGPVVTSIDRSKAPLLLTASSSLNNMLYDSTSYVWIGSGCNIYRYRVSQVGGRPDIVLRGHLTTVTSLAVQCVGHHHQRIWSGSADGMILSWGYQAKRERNNKVPHLNYSYQGYDASRRRKASHSSDQEDQDLWSDDD